jgi:hypothetical protein
MGSIEVVKEPSIMQTGEAVYRIGDKVFVLTSDNFNYYDFLRPRCIKSMSIEGNIARIDLDREVIRHCSNRFILIDLDTKQITWNDVSPSDNPEYTKWDHSTVLTPDKLAVRVIS